MSDYSSQVEQVAMHGSIDTPPARHSLNEQCRRCKLTYGSHRAGGEHPTQCPAHEGHMDWPPPDKATYFLPSGIEAVVPSGTPSAV